MYTDFCQPFRPFESEADLEAIRANVLSGSELVQAVRRTTGDMLVLICGGGGEEQFGVFDHPDLLHAWVAKPVYRIVGVGHSANSTALELLSNFVATTPAAAGVHIAELLRNAHETHRMLAGLRTEDDELRVQVPRAKQPVAARDGFQLHRKADNSSRNSRAGHIHSFPENPGTRAHRWHSCLDAVRTLAVSELLYAKQVERH